MPYSPRRSRSVQQHDFTAPVMTSSAHLGTTPPLQDPTTASPWVPLWRIIEQIASAIGDSREAEHYAKTRLYIRQAAADKGLRIRGRREIEVANQNRTIF